MDTITFPSAISEAISQELAKVDHQSLVASSKRLSENLRINRDEDTPFFYSPKDIAGYVALRTPATYAQVYSALMQVKEMLPNFKPHSLLDIGSGPGTALWVTQTVFPSLRAVTMIDRQKEFIALSKIIAALFPKLNIDWQQSDFLTRNPRLEYMYDLVIIANVLDEVGEFERKKMIELAKEHCSGVIIIIEPATPHGITIIDAVSLQFSQTGNFIAPFVANSFVSSQKDWIHFSQKIIRPEFQKRIRQALREDSLSPSDIEEAKYTFVAWSKDLALMEKPWGRLLAKPEIQKGLVLLTVLTADGIEKIRILKRDKEMYHFAKNLKWGEIIENRRQLGL